MAARLAWVSQHQGKRSADLGRIAYCHLRRKTASRLDQGSCGGRGGVLENGKLSFSVSPPWVLAVGGPPLQGSGFIGSVSRGRALKKLLNVRRGLRRKIDPRLLAFRAKVRRWVGSAQRREADMLTCTNDLERCVYDRLNRV